MMRLIDADAVLTGIEEIMKSPWYNRGKTGHGEDVGFMHVAYLERKEAVAIIRDLCIKGAPTVSAWVNVKDRLPEEHPSIFAPFYGTDRWYSTMWRTESDRVLVSILFPDGSRTVDKGRLNDGEWRTGVSPVLRQQVTHWQPWPEPPKESDPHEML